jgi:cytoskeleton protein RodZ
MIDSGLTVGQNLQKRREEKNIPLKHVAQVTRISLLTLQALERDEFYRLPGECFTRGFLRNYAKVIQLDPDEVIAAYRHQTEGSRRQVLDEASAPPASTSLLKNVRNHVFDFVSTLMGAPPSFSINKIVLPPKD